MPVDRDSPLKDEPWMRTQLQRGHQHFDSWPIRPDPRFGYVTVRQVLHGLRMMARNRCVPHSQRGDAEAALKRASAWIQARPPGGWLAYDTYTELFDLTDADGFRLDTENLRGHNLKS